VIDEHSLIFLPVSGLLAVCYQATGLAAVQGIVRGQKTLAFLSRSILGTPGPFAIFANGMFESSGDRGRSLLQLVIFDQPSLPFLFREGHP
jgi:hypothetical protein